MSDVSPDSQGHSRLYALLKLRIWVGEWFRPTELQITLFWAGIIGFIGALASVGFRWLIQAVHWLFTRQTGGHVEAFAHLPMWERILIPTLGGLLAGLTLLLGKRWKRNKISTDYMEAIVLGDGHVPARLSIVKSCSALWSIASGASIGREGPLVQLSAMAASLIGRISRANTLQLRVLVACGAAAGIASAYNAPIAGALFVAEIILRSLAMETFGPLVFASVVSTLTIRQLLGSNPLYEIHVPEVRLYSNWEILLYAVLGLLAGVLCPLFLRLLQASERAFSKLPTPIYLRLALGGLCVGLLATVAPEVCGNGYSVINMVLHGEIFWKALVLVLVLKVIATAATFGSGAVGGVFTPTLFVGACLGQIFAQSLQGVWPGPPLVPSAFTLVGMGAFLAAATQAPLMAILILFELTLDYLLITPLMLACVVAHYTARAFNAKSIYSESLTRKGAGLYQQQLAMLRVTDIMKPDPPVVMETERFAKIAEEFLHHRFSYLYVIDQERRFRGAISLHDIKAYLHEPDLAEIVMARDILREQFPTIPPDASLSDALIRFSHHDGERLPVITANGQHLLLGSIAKTDLLLALTEQAKQATAGGGGGEK